MKVQWRETKLLKKYSKKSVMFCENCLNINPEMEDGYTLCCNELRVTYPIALRMAKQNDILNALQLKFKASSNGDLRGWNSKATFELPNKKKSFQLNMEDTEKGLNETLSLAIKGLKKEF